MPFPVLRPRPGGRRLAMFAGVGALHAVVLVVLIGVLTGASPARSLAVLGLLATAYLLGVRHAFDADHIAAIDNTTRRLMDSGHRDPASVGFWFSLGHSTVVVVAAGLVGLGSGVLAAQVQDDGSVLHEVTGVLGTLVSVLFLLVVGILNAVALVGLIRRRRRASVDAPMPGGLLGRLLTPVLARVDRPSRMFPVGFLFGLGFDTATEVALLVLTGGSHAIGFSGPEILVVPLAFTAGMCLFDSADGAVMATAYRYTAGSPVGRLRYTVLMTSLSIAVALGVGSLEIVALLTDRFGLPLGGLQILGGLDQNLLGFVVVGALLAAWLVGALVFSRRHGAAGRMERAG